MNLPAIVSAIARSILVVLQYLLLARVLLSWLPMQRTNSFVRFIYMITEPVLAPVRSFLTRFEFMRRLPLDFSVPIVFIVISLLYQMI